MSLANIRKGQIELRYKEVPYLKQWLKNPYTCFKARLYIELSSVIIYLCLRFKIQPNTVSVVCISAYVVAGILVAIPDNAWVIAGAVIFFFNPTLDWADGALARTKGLSSLSGHLLDVYEAHLSVVCLHTALGFFIASSTGHNIFYYLSALIPFLFAANAYHICTQYIIDAYQQPETAAEINRYRRPAPPANTLVLVKLNAVLEGIFDARARGVDLLLALIVIEIFFPIRILWIIFIFLVIKYLLQCISALQLIAAGGWAEYYLDRRVNEIVALEKCLKRKDRPS